MLILCTAEVSPRIKEIEAVAEIRYAGWATEQKILTEAEMASLLAAVNPDILLTSYDPVTRAVIDSAPNLKMLVCTRASPVNVDLAYCREKGIPVSYSPGRNSDCTAEYTVAMMLSVMRRIPFAFHDLKMGKHTNHETATAEVEIKGGLRRDVTWALGADTPYIVYKGAQMRGKTAGIIGYGSIGSRVGAICYGFGMQIIAFDPYATNVPPFVRLVPSLDALAAEADVISIHCKDTPETYHLVDKKFLDKMKRTAYLVNTSRGVMVNEADLADALRHRRIAGAALDVFDREPIADAHPFLRECDNIVVTPHLAGATFDAIDNHTIQLLADVGHFIRKEPLEFEYH